MDIPEDFHFGSSPTFNLESDAFNSDNDFDLGSKLSSVPSGFATPPGLAVEDSERSSQSAASSSTDNQIDSEVRLSKQFISYPSSNFD